MLTQQQTDIVKATVPVLKEHGTTVTNVFYNNILNENPSLKSIFNSSNQATGNQPRALAGAVLAYAANIDNLAVLGPALQRICHKHASLHVQAEHYPIVGKYLLQAFAQCLGDAWTPELEAAWAAAYGQLAQIMIDAEASLYADNEWKDWREFVIEEKIIESSEITSFVFKPVDKRPLPLHRPGQYVSIMIDVPILGHGQVRQYSLSDKPSQEYYRISVRRDAGIDASNPKATAHPGYVSNLLHAQKKAGDIVLLSHPRGDFYLNQEAKPTAPLVLLSAGVGLTPLMSMLNTTLPKSPERPVAWIHGAHSTENHAFCNYIQKQAELHQNLRTSVFITEPREADEQGVDYSHAGRVDLDKCDKERDLFLNEPSAEYYICGPRGFMLGTQDKLLSFGVDASRIRMELFGTGGVN